MHADPVPEMEQRNPEMAALLGVCIGAGLFYVGRKKTAVASICLAVILIGVELHYHILWPLFLLAVLWYWQMWYGYDKAEESNADFAVAVELSKEPRPDNK